MINYIKNSNYEVSAKNDKYLVVTLAVTNLLVVASLYYQSLFISMFFHSNK